MKQLLIITAGVVHPPITAVWKLRKLIRDIPDIQVHTAHSLEIFSALPLNAYAGVVLYYHKKRLSETALAGFDRFVKAGGGVLAVHSATASLKGQDRYFEILGGGFNGHGPVSPFEIYPVKHTSNSPIFSVKTPFTIIDELYEHKLYREITPHFYARTAEGHEHPVVWTHTYGEGRVCYACPGHRTQTLSVPEVRDIIRNGLAWTLRQTEVAHG